MTSVYDFSAQSLDGGDTPLSRYRGEVLLIVNVASKCGFTPQYDGLEKIYRQYRERGFSVLGFPCNQFGAQEPGSSSDIADFCSTRYDVTFPMFAKIDVNGDKAHPLYGFLRRAKPGLLGSTAIKWNFTKFLINRKGEVVNRYAPTATPQSLAGDIEKELQAPRA